MHKRWIKYTVSKPHGTIELVCGCMFSGKSERLLERIAEARSQGITVAAFKHASDDRYSLGHIVTHSSRKTEALHVSSGPQLVELAGDAQLVVIDEAQFFDADIVEACQQLAERGSDVVLAGLDRDSWGEPFDPVPAIEALADKVTRTRASCAVCSQVADYTQRTAPVGGQKMIGGAESYEPRCAKCFQPPPAELRR